MRQKMSVYRLRLGLEWVNGANLLPKESIFDQSLQRSDDAFYKDSEPGRS